MGQGTQALKNRIRSIQATKKITSAMKLIATSKLKKQKALMEKNKDYAFYLKDTLAKILAQEHLENEYLVVKEDTAPCTIFFSSDLGLCGGYNANMLKLIEKEISTEESLFVVGAKGKPWLKAHDYKIVNEFINSDTINFQDLSKLANQVLEMYRKQEITSIRILFTRFVNSMSFMPEIVKLLPVEKEEREADKSYVETIFEPNADEILNDLIPMVVRSLVYSYWLETKTAEQASRRLAMESATDNAEDLIEQLVLEFNQARQAAITQEISEIVGGANAL